MNAMDTSRHPHSGKSALVIVDMISTWQMKNGAQLLRQAVKMAPQLASLARRARSRGVAVVYANDNFGHWRSDMPSLLEQARQSHPLSATIVDALAPLPGDYFVLKPAHSAFFQSPLEKLLDDLHVGKLVLAGASGDQCVLATASDALLRGFKVVVPRSTIASPTPARSRHVLEHFRVAMDIATPDARSLRWQS